MNTRGNIIRLVAIALIALAAAWACTKEEPAKVAVVTVEDRYPGISMGMLKNATLADMTADLVAEAGEAKITGADLQSMLQELPQEYLPQLQKNLIFLLEQRVARTILLQEAKAVGVTTEGVSDEEVIQGLANHVAQTATVADEDIQKFFEANKALIGEATLEEVKDTIQAMLLQERQQAVLTAFIEQLEKRARIRVNREWFEQQSRLTRDNPVDQARLSGKPSVVQFGVPSSVPSEMMTPVLEGLQQKHAGALNVVVVNVGDEAILGARYGIRSVPTQVFFDKAGKEISRNQGVLDEEELAKEAARVITN
jgi:thioredoxin-like negative regulator of GroEL